MRSPPSRSSSCARSPTHCCRGWTRIVDSPSSMTPGTSGLRRVETPRLVGMRIFRAPFASVHPLYVAQAERKGRTRAEVDEVIRWLTGFSQAELEQHLAAEPTFEDFFVAARLNPAASLITGRSEEHTSELQSLMRISYAVFCLKK